jgi:hypothetical protein
MENGYNPSFKVRDLVAGGVGASLNVTVGLPFEVVKVRLQTNPTGYSGLWSTLTSIVRQEGVLTLWSGMSPALVSSLIENSVLFAANGLLRRGYARATDHETTRSFSFWEEFCIGGLSGVFSGTAITPAEVLRVNQQHMEQKAGSNMYTLSRDMLRSGGLGGLFRGLVPTLCRDVPYCMIQFSLFNTLHKRIAVQGHKPTALELFTMGGIAGSGAWMVIFPMDTIKSRCQVDAVNGRFTGLWDGVKQTYATGRGILQKEGVLKMYRGYGAAVMRAFPANGGLFMGVTLTHRVFNRVYGLPPTMRED